MLLAIFSELLEDLHKMITFTKLRISTSGKTKARGFYREA